MSYKIVQTWENNKNTLLAVPSTWEENNILKYPRKNINKYLKIGTSLPETGWKQMKCNVKRSKLPSYETADYVLQEMLNHTDTEDDNTNTATCKQSKPQLNLNIVADEIVNLHSKLQVGNPNTFQESPDTYHHDVIQQNKNGTTMGPAAENSGLPFEYVIPMCDTNVNTEHFAAFTPVHDNNLLLTNQNKMLAQLDSIQNVQTVIIQKIASLSVQLDDTLLQINNYLENGNLQVVPLGACKSNQSNTAFNIKPIDTVQQLDELELELSNSANRQQKKQLYSVIFSGGKGIDCAYTLADVLFSRELLCLCSWSGGSRGNNEAKIAWKAYKNILSFFWEMVHSWDSKYTVSQNVEFFKSILKNAKKRNMAKKERASTSRKRTKPSKRQSVNDEIESEKGETPKKAKIEKKQIEKDEKGIEDKEKESTKTLDPIIEEYECNIEELDKEKTNDNGNSGDVDSNIDEIENTVEEEKEDHEREEDTSNDEESTVDSDGTFENVIFEGDRRAHQIDKNNERLEENKENENIGEKQKKEKNRDKETHSKSKKYIENKNKMANHD